MSEITFTDQNFEEEVVNSRVPVLVDFWATWCGPCQVMGPIIEELVKDYEGKGIKIGKINIDENSEMAEKYGVMSIPNLIFFKKGEIANQLLGVQSKKVLEDKIKEMI
ncbi:MAG: thioredoxin [bacterium]